MKKDILKEAKAFDLRIIERIKNGHIPDLRRVKFCEWFYNNPWRHPEYVKWVFGEYFSYSLSNLKRKNMEILEVGCGAGYMSLELARYGHNVTGIDISKESIKIAKKMKKENPYTENMGKLNYYVSGLFEFTPKKKFDVICFFLVLHHFNNLEKVMKKVSNLLKENGMIIVIEPAVDWFSLKNAFFVSLIRILLAYNKKWYENIELPSSEEELKDYINDVYNEFRETRDKKEKKQSPHDNSSKGAEMLKVLNKYFKKINFKYGYSFLSRVVGGVREEMEEKTLKLANFLKVFDILSVKEKILEPTSFYFSGRLKEGLCKKK